MTKKIAVTGFGNIGTGVVEILYQKGVKRLELAKVVDIDIKSKRPVDLPVSYLTTARRSRLGVIAAGCPAQPMVSLRCWSGKISKILGLSAITQCPLFYCVFNLSVGPLLFI